MVAYGDGGGRAFAFPQPVHGQERVARLLVGLRNRVVEWGIQLKSVHINGQPGALFLDADGGLLFVVSLDIADGLVQTVHAVSNPDKLQHLGRMSGLISRD